MPEPNGDRLELTAYFDTESGRHKLAIKPESLRICKRNTRVVAVFAKNETVATKEYKPIVLEYRIYDGASTTAERNPERVFRDGPNFPNASFIVPDDGKPCYFMIKDELGIKTREKPCTFPSEGPDEYSVIVRFTHQGWSDDTGSGEHHDLHVES